MPKQTTCIIIVFTRFPVEGKAKTRLIPLLGAAGAAALQKMMTEFTVLQVRQTQLPLEIRFTGATESEMEIWLGDGHSYARQSYVCQSYIKQDEGDLGQRMAAAFADAFQHGSDKVIVIGSDCPDNRTANLMQAVEALDTSPCVIGPAYDGGYYLLGLRAPQPHLFQDIDWGSEKVFQQTIDKLNDYMLLPTLHDVDEPHDLPAKISVIIPTLNEAAAISSCLEMIAAAFHVEIIVVDGGSTDATLEIAQQKGASVYHATAGRANQMNIGAANASGEILFFLHADSQLPQDWDRHVRQTIKQTNVSLGHFRFAISGNFSGKKLVECGTHIRSTYFKKPYGDQGLFIARTVFEAIGGYPDVPILEDVLLVKRAKKHGKISQVSAALVTSGRRWQKHGCMRVVLFNQAVLLVAALGGDLEKLKQAYQKGTNPLRVLFSLGSGRPPK